jgi:hypothetical protein
MKASHVFCRLSMASWGRLLLSAWSRANERIRRIEKFVGPFAVLSLYKLADKKPAAHGRRVRKSNPQIRSYEGYDRSNLRKAAHFRQYRRSRIRAAVLL